MPQVCICKSGKILSFFMDISIILSSKAKFEKQNNFKFLKFAFHSASSFILPLCVYKVLYQTWISVSGLLLCRQKHKNILNKLFEKQLYDDSVLSRMFYRSLFVIWLYEVQGWKLYYRYVWRDSDSNFRYKFQRNFMDTDLKGIIIEFMERFELKEKVNDVQNANFSRCLMIMPLHCLWAI